MSSVSTMMTMRDIASGDDGDDEEGQDQDHGHNELGAVHTIQPIPRATARSENEMKVKRWQRKGV